MRVAVISDVHANWPALQAVLLHLDSVSPDQVLVGGDVINRGAQSRECLELVLDRICHRGWKIIRGNHEDYVLRVAGGIHQLAMWEQQVMAHTAWTEERVRDYLPVIREWPDELEVAAPDGSTLLLTHASRKGNRVGLYDYMNDEELLDHAHPHARALCVGHTHVPFVRRIGERMIVNAGAVGMPFDGDHRAAYALLDWSTGGWNVEIVRVPYDRAATRRAYDETGYMLDGGPLVPMICWELQHARACLGRWHARFEKMVASGTISLEASVQEMLRIA